jgi:RNA-directed DNA polymerase
MKRVNNLITKVADMDNLRLAFWKASKGKRYSPAVLSYQEVLDQNLYNLREQFLGGRVIVGDYHYFKVFEPKERQICASSFREQVLHHALMNICHEYFERVQIFHSYASRKGKGTYGALDMAKNFTLKYTWYLKLDVKKFFESIHHEVLKRQLAGMFKDWLLLDAFEKIIDSYYAKEHRGVPIGNLCSQYFANHYLTGLDHFIKEKLKINAYVRYMDDMVLWHNDKNVLKTALVEIVQFLEVVLLCQLKPIGLNKSSSGLPFLGYHIFPHYVHLLQKSKQRFCKKMGVIDRCYHTETWTQAECQRRAQALLAFVQHADSKSLQKSLTLRLSGQLS